MNRVTLARNAMATRFELVLAGDAPVSLRAAGEEALDEIERVESLLSVYIPRSEIAQVNARAAFEPVPVSPMVFGLIARARELWRITEGAFDITIGPLVRCWGFARGNGSMPTQAEIDSAKARVGMDKVELDESSRTVFFQTAGMTIDMGSIGKGFAIDLAIEILRECGVENAFLQGGTSSMYAIGSADPNLESEGWKVSISRPELQTQSDEQEVISVVNLGDCSLSVSGLAGKCFMHDGRLFGHVIDPRIGWPGDKGMLGAVRSGSAAESDALSTAVLLGSRNQLEHLRKRIQAPFDFLQVGINGEILQSGFQILASGTPLGKVGSHDS